MPGILPMKVIKVGTSAQSRIAQACDRCRSKKIRCDGIRPCCSQCSNVGFECKTSDKLSRRAFPRGYTESLEERVRALEGEVRELKDLLDEKDEKIDMLSRMHNNRRISHSSLGSSPVLVSSLEEAREDTFRVQYSQPGTESDGNSAFLGASTGRIFVDAFKRKLQDSGKSCSGFNPAGFLPSYQGSPSETSPETTSSSIPPRLFSDRCINIFWQEHAPLFPVLHKPSFLRLYEEYVAKPEEMVDNQKLAMLHLVFCIAGFSSDLPDKDDIALCERQWRKALNAIVLDGSLSTLQCLVLACLYCSQTGDYESLQTYKAVAVGLSQRLGLHFSQKRFSHGALLNETRKKVFWTLYTVDCFSAASMGLPQLLNDTDIETEYPTAIDDEYVEETRYLPTLPGETSKLSNALALFDATRILSKVLRKLYPANPSQDLSLQDMATLESELDQWSEKLPQHLKLTFIADKPSVRVTGDRSALLSLAYYHIRSLLHRPAIGSTLGSKASASIIAVANASKAIVQIVQLLEERSMSFSFCINKNTTLTLCGLSLLYQGLDLKKEGHLIREGQRMVCAISSYLDKYNAPGAADFKKLLSSLALAPSSQSPPTSSPTTSIHRSTTAPIRTKSSVSAQPSQQRQVIIPTSRVHSSHTSASRSNSSSAADHQNINSELILQQERMRRATLHSFPTIPQPHLNGHHGEQSRQQPAVAKLRARTDSNGTLASDYRNSCAVMETPVQAHRHLAAASAVRSPPSLGSESGLGSPLDYMSLGTPSPPMEQMCAQPKIRRVPSGETQFIAAPQQQQLRQEQVLQEQFQKQQLQQSNLSSGEWESLLGNLDSGSANNIFDAVYGGTNHSAVLPIHTVPQNSQFEGQQQCQSEENLGAFEHWEIANDAASAGWVNLEFDPATGDVGPQSVFSYSEESLSSDGEAGGLEYPGLVEYRQMFELF